MLQCYVQGRVIPKLVPARPHRDWMDQFPERHPYRCLPLAVANTFGWELISPCDVRIEWNGGPEIPDLKVTAEDGFPDVKDFAMSNFARGIVSFHTGYLFVTDPGWLLLATGPLNDPIDGLAPLTGLIETDWLPYPFTMNWQVQRPGVFRIKKGQSFCHILPVQVEPLLQTTPEILDFATNPDLAQRVAAYRQKRVALRNTLLAANMRGEDAPSWSKEYFQGKLGDGTTPIKHYQKIRMAEPVDRQPPAGPPSPPGAGIGYKSGITFDLTPRKR